jgi:hypothetical protein
MLRRVWWPLWVWGLLSQPPSVVTSEGEKEGEMKMERESGKEIEREREKRDG